MNETQFDNIIRNGIGRYESPVSPGMWERIFPQDKKRRFFVWWWILPGAVLFTGLFLSGVFDKVKKKPETSKKSETTVVVKENKKNRSEKKIIFLPDTQRIRSNNKQNKSSSQYYLQSNQTITEPVNDSTHQAESIRQPYTHSIPNTVSLYKKPSINLKVSFTDTTSPAQKERFMKKLNPWFAEIYTGPAIAKKSTDASFYSYDENSRLSFHSGILIGKYLSKRFYLKTGITYTSIREKYKEDSVTLSEENGYNAFDIPLIAGYALIDKKIKVNLQAGVIYNFYAWRKDFVRPENYKKSGWKTQASINILYPVGEKLQLMMEPYYIRQLTNMYRYDSYDVKIQQSGLSVGARYTIPNRQHH